MVWEVPPKGGVIEAIIAWNQANARVLTAIKNLEAYESPGNDFRGPPFRQELLLAVVEAMGQVRAARIEVARVYKDALQWDVPEELLSDVADDERP